MLYYSIVTSLPKRSVGRNGKAQSKKHDRTSVMPKRQKGKRAKRETAETDGTYVCVYIYIYIHTYISLNIYIIYVS